MALSGVVVQIAVHVLGKVCGTTFGGARSRRRVKAAAEGEPVNELGVHLDKLHQAFHGRVQFAEKINVKLAW